jgi:hypothetical protein
MSQLKIVWVRLNLQNKFVFLLSLKILETLVSFNNTVADPSLLVFVL